MAGLSAPGRLGGVKSPGGKGSAKGVGGCPAGSVQVPLEKRPAPPGSPNPYQMACPPGATRNNAGSCCQPKGGAGGGGGGFQLPAMGWPGGSPGAPPGGGAPVPGPVPRPELQPISPQAAYDPEIAKALAERREYTESLEGGTTRSMEVMQASMNDQIESQVAQARASAEAAGIPFDEGAYRAQLQKDVHAGLAQHELGREALIGQSLAQGAGIAGTEAQERNARLGINLQAQQATMQDLLARYGIDVQKYGVDVDAATAANNALLDFYSRLMSGMFSMVGSQSLSADTYYS